jgi:uncharacterized protein
MKQADIRLSVLGFGCMRLPITASGKIDEKQATGMIRHAVDSGINYFDTAYVYHNGESEPFLGRALSDGYRENVYIATKMPVWSVEKKEDMDLFLDEQLKRLKTDHIDFYLLHGLVNTTWNAIRDLGVFDFLDQAVADGRVRFAGFSFHDSFAVFREIVTGYDWTFCQIQYNYMDEEYQAGLEGLKYASEKNLDVMVMEPLRGGTLTRQTDEFKRIWEQSGVSRTPAEWGLRFVWDRPEVTVALSGMSHMAQLKENLVYADLGYPGTLSPAEHGIYQEIRELYRRKMKIPCTRCGYCLPCPSGVAIPDCFSMYNDAFIYDDAGNARLVYEVFSGFGGAASQCQDCGVCESLCPQHLPIRKYLREVEVFFGK